ncbi:MAG: hypothetical protein ACI33J_08790 [Clostridium sp.]
MSVFSEKLNFYITKSGLSIPYLSNKSGLSNNEIITIKSGHKKSLENYKDGLKLLIFSLTVSDSIKNELIETLDMEILGEDKYSSYIFTKKFIESISSSLTINFFSKSTPTIPTIDVVYGNYNVNNIVRSILELEASKENGTINIISQCDFEFLMNILPSICYRKDNLNIEHIFCFDNSNEFDHNIENIKCVKTTFPIKSSCYGYEPYFYYDNTKSVINKNSSFPYIIVTNDYALNISYDYSSATIFNSKDILNIFKDFFYKLKKNCTKLFNINNHSLYNFNNPNNCIYSLSFQPDFLSFIDKNNFKKISLKESNSYNILKLFSFKNNIKKIFFSDEGLEFFVKTGFIHNDFDTISPKDRLFLLNNLYDYINNGNAFIINSTFFKVPYGLSINIYNKFEMDFNYKISHEKFIYFNEKSICFSIYSFIDYLIESKYIFSKENALILIKENIKTIKL